MVTPKRIRKQFKKTKKEIKIVRQSLNELLAGEPINQNPPPAEVIRRFKNREAQQERQRIRRIE